MYPQLTLDLDAVARNATVLADRLMAQGIELVGVTKALDGEPLVGQAMLEAGCAGLADSRLPSLVRLAAHALAPLTLIRSPQPYEIETAAQVADRVILTDASVAARLGELAPGLPVEVLLAVDLGDRREGVLPDDAADVATTIAALPGVTLSGIAVNFACLSGQLPTLGLFHEAETVLASLAELCEPEPLLSLGGTCCLQVLDGYRPRQRTEVRSGGGPLYGYDFVSATSLDGLERSDPLLEAVVLECFEKPPAPPGPAGFDALGHRPDTDLPSRPAWYALIALGHRDCERHGLRPLLPGYRLAGMTSDVGVLITPGPLSPGDTVGFAVDYDALVRAVTSPFVEKRFAGAPGAAGPRDPEGPS